MLLQYLKLLGDFFTPENDFIILPLSLSWKHNAEFTCYIFWNASSHTTNSAVSKITFEYYFLLSEWLCFPSFSLCWKNLVDQCERLWKRSFLVVYGENLCNECNILDVNDLRLLLACIRLTKLDATVIKLSTWWSTSDICWECYIKLSSKANFYTCSAKHNDLLTKM